VAAMSRVENGKTPDKADITKGFSLQGKITQ
jgi:hypothetical protein